MAESCGASAASSGGVQTAASDPGDPGYLAAGPPGLYPDVSPVAVCRSAPVCSALGPLVAACLLPRLISSAVGSDPLTNPAWGHNTLPDPTLTVAVDACNSLLARASPQLALRVLTSSLVTTWIRSSSAYYKPAAINSSPGSPSTAAGPSLKGTSEEASLALDHYVGRITDRMHSMVCSTRAEISAAGDKAGTEEGLACKEGIALLEVLRGQLRGPLLSLLDSLVLDGLTMQEGLLYRVPLFKRLRYLLHLHSTVLMLAGLCSGEDFSAFCQKVQQLSRYGDRGNDSGEDNACSGDTAATDAAEAARQHRLVELREQYYVHTVPFNALMKLISDANAALMLHRRSLSPESKAAVLPPGAKTATRPQRLRQPCWSRAAGRRGSA